MTEAGGPGAGAQEHPRGAGSATAPHPAPPGRVVITVAAVVLAVLGGTAVARAVTSPEHPPRPPPSAVRSTAPISEAPPAPPLVLPMSEPVAIDIPAIGVHSTLQYLGLTEEGALEVPAPGPHYNEAAWYRYSPTPGSLGPAIIFGHVDSARDGPSVFFRLGDLRPGDKVMVARADGLIAEFRVDGVRRDPKDEFPTQLVYGNTDRAALRLLTCGGTFDVATGHYLDNVIVLGSLVASHHAAPTPAQAGSIGTSGAGVAGAMRWSSTPPRAS